MSNLRPLALIISMICVFKQTDGQTDGQTDKQTNIKIDREKFREINI